MTHKPQQNEVPTPATCIWSIVTFLPKKHTLQLLYCATALNITNVTFKGLDVYEALEKVQIMFVDLIQLLDATGISCGSIPAQKSSADWISVLSKPSVARMVMTTLLR